MYCYGNSLCGDNLNGTILVCIRNPMQFEFLKLFTIDKNYIANNVNIRNCIKLYDDEINFNFVFLTHKNQQ